MFWLSEGGSDIFSVFCVGLWGVPDLWVVCRASEFRPFKLWASWVVRVCVLRC